MKAFTLSALSTMFAGLTLAFPVDMAKRTAGPRFSNIDITILQFALTLEHLENTFYREAFSRFKLQDFLNAGFDEDFFINLQFIAGDESAHVDLLQAAISGAGVRPVAPCKYNFGVTDVASFVTLSAILESVGTSAYLGAAPFVGSKDILAVAASIMVTEALHTSLQRSSIGGIGAPDPFGTSLDANSVFSLAAQFIVSCPADNPPLPFTAFPGLKVDAQPCFKENGGFTTTKEAAGYYSSIVWKQIDTTAADYVTYVADSTATYVADTTTTTTTTTMDMKMETTTTTMDMKMETSTTTTDMKMETLPTMDMKMETTTTTTTEMKMETIPTVDMMTMETTSTTEMMPMETTSTTEMMPMETTSTTTPTEAMPEATYAPPMPYRRRDLDVRTPSSKDISCPAPFSGSPVTLRPDFSSLKRDFRKINRFFATFISGLNVVSVEGRFASDRSLRVNIPSAVQGQVYIFITTVDVSGKKLKDSDVLFGPAIMEVAPKVPALSS